MSGEPVEKARKKEGSSQERADESEKEGGLEPVPAGAEVSRTASALEEERPTTISWVRAVASAGQRMMALGLLAVIGSAMLNAAVAVRLISPLARDRGLFLGEGIMTSLAGGLLAQFGLLIVLPVLAWGLGWILDDRPFRLAFGGAVFAEIWHMVIMILTAGLAAFWQDPAYIVSRLICVGVAGLLGGLAFGHARRMAERADARENGT